MLAAVMLHEFGHYFFIKLCGARIKRIDIEPLGALIVYADGDTGLNEDIAIAAGGVIFNISAAIAGIVLFAFFYELHLFIFIATNLALAFVNLLPVSNLDGGRMLMAILLKKCDIVKAERTSSRVSVAGKVLLLIISALLVVASGYNTALIILFLLNIIQINN